MSNTLKIATNIQTHSLVLETSYRKQNEGRQKDIL